MNKKAVSRRDFMKLAALGAGGLALRPFDHLFRLPEFPEGDRLGRVCHGKWELKARPNSESATVDVVFDDAVLPWLREVVGNYSPWRNNHRWIETPLGYIWGAYFQPVRNQPNAPVTEIPSTSIGPGMWVEVTVPYVDVLAVNPPLHPEFKWRHENGRPLRFYYSQVLWVDQMRTEADGRIFYRINEKYGNRGDVLWGDARAFRPLTLEDVAPITPEVENKRVEVDITYKRQYMSCYEDDQEVYFCRISSGVSAGSTPVGSHSIWRKLVSIHMEGGTAQAGWDTGGVGWTNLFTGNGVAIHSTYWHNNFGEPESNGCVNVAPEDARWIWRWTNPVVTYDPGEKTITDYSATKIKVTSAD